MCLGIPGQVIHMLEGYGDQLALVDVAGEHRKVNSGMLPEETFAPGDWVIIHMGFVVEKTDKAGADAAMEGLELMGRGRDIETSPWPLGAGYVSACTAWSKAWASAPSSTPQRLPSACQGPCATTLPAPSSRWKATPQKSTTSSHTCVTARRRWRSSNRVRPTVSPLSVA